MLGPGTTFCKLNSHTIWRKDLGILRHGSGIVWSKSVCVCEGEGGVYLLNKITWTWLMTRQNN